MAAPVTALASVKLPTGPSPLSPEQRYWRSFKNPSTVPTPAHSPVTSISSVSAHLLQNTLAVTAGPRVLLVDPRAGTVARQIARFPAAAHGVHFRPGDGRVLVAGDEAGGIQVFDARTRAVLRTWRGGAHAHRQGVWVTRFAPAQPTALLSASDDATVRIWDLAADAPTCTFTGHGDYIRAAAYLPGPAAGPAGLIVSGSYDQTVRVWDPRTPERAALTFQHDAPIEAVLPTPAGSTVLAAAGAQITVLDLVGARPLRVLESHQKTVTSLCLASKDTRLVSGSLDGHIKVFESSGWNLVAGSKYPSPILALDVTQQGTAREDRHLVVGLQSGVISVRTRLSGQQKVKERARQKEMDALLHGSEESQNAKRAKPSGVQKRLRGRDYLGEDADVIIDGNPRTDRGKKLEPWQNSLRAGRYGAALDQTLEMNDPVKVLTLLIALRHRSAMHAALGGRDEVALQPILRWIHKHLVDPRYVEVCTETAAHVLALYAGHAGQSPAVDDLLRSIHAQVRREIDRAQQAWQTDGMLGMLITPR